MWLVLHLYFFFWKSKEEFARHYIETRLEKEIAEAQTLLKNDLEGAFGYEYPVFIFENRYLVFWNNHKFDLPFIDRNDDPLYFIKNDQGDFVVLSKITPQRSFYILIPLRYASEVNNQYLHSSPNYSIIPRGIEGISINKPGDEQLDINYQGNPLFSINAASFELKNHPLQWLLLLLMAFTLIALVIWLWRKAIILDHNHFGRGLIVLLLSLMAIRAFMLYLQLPFRYIDIPLFDARYYASSLLSPSYGDLFLNMTGYVLFICYIWTKKSQLLWRLRYNVYAFAGLAVLYVLTLSLAHLLTRTVYNHSTFLLNMGQVLDDITFKSIYYLIMGYVIVSMLLLSDVINRFFLSKRIKVLMLVIASVSVGIIFSIGWSWLMVVVTVFISMTLGTLSSTLNRATSFRKFGRHQVFNLIATVTLTSLLITLSVREYTFDKYKLDQQSVGNILLTSDDILGEYLLDEAIDRISDDVIIQNRIFNPLAGKRIIYERTLRILGGYFDKYNVDIRLFNGEGMAINTTDTVQMKHFEDKYQKAEYSTVYEDIYYQPPGPGLPTGTYACFIPLKRYDVVIGNIVLLLNLRQFTPGSAYPFLLADQQMETFNMNSGVSYAIFRDDELYISSGTFNYQSSIIDGLLNSKLLFEEGVMLDGVFHVGQKSLDSEQVVIVSRRYSSALQSISQFCFVSIFFALVILIVVIIIRAILYRITNQALAVRIQLFAIFVLITSFFLVGVISMSISISQNQRFLIDEYQNKMDQVRFEIMSALDEYFSYNISNEELNAMIGQLSKKLKIDLNMYSNRGVKIASSLPLIFDNHTLSENINPVVLDRFFGSGVQSILVDENIGKLNYFALYEIIRPPGDNNNFVIANIPFYEDTATRKSRVIDIFLVLVIILYALLVTILPVSYFIARRITSPLQILAGKIREISLSRENKPIPWQGTDEVGMLVREYNTMLRNLEVSKEALKRQEKETAWREMAKQVAHEIKNPLTPMKLSLQHFQRTLYDENQKNKITSLLKQLETISDIATSFSAFAKMPVPAIEPFNLAETLKHTVELHHKGDAEIDLYIETESIICQGDEKLMGRILSNLILNGIQSVHQKKPKIDISLQKNTNEALISIRDNGSGIPEDIQSKIFIPNFTTKEAGSGIGLAIAKRGIEYVGGKIWFETSSEGTVFYIELPVVSS